MAIKLKKTVVLVGMMGAGKSAVGSALAQMLGVGFLDSDDEIRSAANMGIAEIFERDGEAFFRQRESEVLMRLLDATPCILSTGGGAFLLEKNREMISQKGVSVWLKADLDLLWSRVRHKDTRPLLRTGDPYATLAKIYGERQQSYAMADLSVTGNSTYSIEEMARCVAKVLRGRADVLEGD